jgi:hypothetical protein
MRPMLVSTALLVAGCDEVLGIGDHSLVEVAAGDGGTGPAGNQGEGVESPERDVDRHSGEIGVSFAKEPRCVLLVYIDDATRRLMELRFVEAESTFDYFAATRGTSRPEGRARSIFAAQHGCGAQPLHFVLHLRHRSDLSF